MILPQMTLFASPPFLSYLASVVCCTRRAGRRSPRTFSLSRATLFLDGARPQIPVAILAKALRAEAIAQEVEALLAAIADAGLGLVQGQSQPGHHLPRPGQGLPRVSATEDDKVIGIVHHLGAEPCALPGDPPVLQKAVHVERGEQRRNNPALRGSPCAPPAARHAPLAIPAGLLDRCLEPQFDQAQDVAIDDPAHNRLHQFRMGNRIEVLGQIRVRPTGRRSGLRAGRWPGSVPAGRWPAVRPRQGSSPGRCVVRTRSASGCRDPGGLSSRYGLGSRTPPGPISFSDGGDKVLSAPPGGAGPGGRGFAANPLVAGVCRLRRARRPARPAPGRGPRPYPPGMHFVRTHPVSTARHQARSGDAHRMGTDDRHHRGVDHRIRSLAHRAGPDRVVDRLGGVE